MDHLLHQLLERAAARDPEAIAVVDADGPISYAELLTLASQLAHVLVGLGVAPGDRVGLYLPKSADAVAAIYGILLAGAVYVPLDPAAPPTRLAYIADDCGVHWLVTATAQRSRWEELAVGAPGLLGLVVMDATSADPVRTPGRLAVVWRDDLAARPGEPPPVDRISLDLAYILYTSGSTGQPKGVKLSHLNALAFVRWAAGEFAVGPADRLSSHAPFHFDLSVFDLFAAAHGGASVTIVPAKAAMFPSDVARFIDTHGITIWYSVPSVLTLLTLRGGLRGGEFPHLRAMLFAGEVFPTRYLRTLMALLPHVRFANLYGPTETNVCTFYDVPVLAEGQDEPIPIGGPIADVDTFAVTDDGRRAAVGEVGELLVRGTTVMQGYWGDEARTAAALVPDPFAPESLDRVYRTGDLVRQQDDGTYVFLGRRDAQIKSRGYRIELGEIEAAIHAHPSVVEAAVVAVPDELVSNRIKAIVVVRDETGERDLSAFCASRVPRYMVPEIWEFRTELPKTSTGKIDRRSLQPVAAS